MWRRRAASTEHPFPQPVSIRAERETFDADEIVEWLAATGRGNNAEAAGDVAAFALVGETSSRDDPVLFSALTCALCLQVIAGGGLSHLDRDALLDLADQTDPDDVLLYSEMHAAADRLPAIAELADLLADASISSEAAFERLLVNRRRFGSARSRASMLRPAATSLVARMAVSLAAGRSPTAVYVEPVPGSHDLLVAVVAEHGDRGPCEVRTPRSNLAEARVGRRRLRTHDIYREDVILDADGTFSVAEPVTHVVQLPGAAAPGMSDAEILSTIENVVVQMDDSQRGVVIASASALCDGFADARVLALRADMLRAGHVRAIVRLPRGLAPARSRQGLALWVLGPSHHEDAVAERRTMVADLLDETLTEDVVQDLVTDVTAATGSRELVRSHTFRFLRPALTRSLLVTKRSLVETVGPSVRVRSDLAELLRRVEQVQVRLSTPPAGLAGLPEIAPGSSQAVRPRETIATLLAARRLHLLPGHRLDESDAQARAGVSVISLAELAGEAPPGSRHIAPLTLASRYDAARLTEPGDVAFCITPRPRALVDHQGGSLAMFPARILRIDPADPGGLVSDVLAADINAAPPHARNWRLWPVRTFTEDQRPLLIDALGRLADGRAEAQDRLRCLDELTDLLIRAATSGSLAATESNPAPSKGH
jgi:hypothetical protein